MGAIVLVPPAQGVAQPEPAAASAPVAVTTYHNDTLRTGWNPHETKLTPTTVATPSFKLLRTVALDDQVDAEPLIVPAQTIVGQGKHNVAYVVTENDTVYAVDTDSGAVMLSVSLGAPVPKMMLPGQCVTNNNHVGINATPVIDLPTQTLYVIAFTLENGKFVYRIHALDLATLADKVPARVIAPSHKLTDGTTLNFLAGAERQRAALLLSGGGIYAGFASFCDIRSDLGRGWVLRWQASSLKPLQPAELLDQLPTAPDNVFLSAVWMSGYGIAAEPGGDIMFVTGNSDPSGTTYNAVTNLAESVVKLTPRMDKVVDYFTPSGPTFGVAALDIVDNDFGAGGVLLLPPQPGGAPPLAVAAGKVGQMYLMNRGHLGGYAPAGPDAVLGSVPIGPCWCGPSYFLGADGIGRVVSSGGANAIVWKVVTAPTVALTQESISATVASRRKQGFFTSVSSNGTRAGSAVIWAAAGPLSAKTTDIVLYAFDAANGSTLFSTVAGTWPNTLGAANTVPVVANGQVYVASYKQLAIFGLGTPAAGAAVEHFAAPTEVALPAGEHEVFGLVRAIGQDRFELVTRDGHALEVDTTEAVKARLAVVPRLGGGLLVRGKLLGDGVLAAASILRAPDQAELWPQDR